MRATPRSRGRFAKLLLLARRVHEQRQGPRGPKVYSLHAPEVECIGKGKAHRPHEFGVKVSVATTLSRASGGQFVTHVKALPGNPYDGHALQTVIPGVTPSTKRTMRPRSAIEPVIGHFKAEHRMERNDPWFKQSDANNAVLAAAGYNFRRLWRLLH